MGKKHKKSFEGWDNKDFFGGIYDFDGNGKTEPWEVMVGLQMFQDIEKEVNASKDINNGRKI